MLVVELRPILSYEFKNELKRVHLTMDIRDTTSVISNILA